MNIDWKNSFCNLSPDLVQASLQERWYSMHRTCIIIATSDHSIEYGAIRLNIIQRIWIQIFSIIINNYLSHRYQKKDFKLAFLDHQKLNELKAQTQTVVPAIQPNPPPSTTPVPLPPSDPAPAPLPPPQDPNPATDQPAPIPNPPPPPPQQDPIPKPPVPDVVPAQPTPDPNPPLPPAPTPQASVPPQATPAASTRPPTDPKILAAAEARLRLLNQTKTNHKAPTPVPQANTQPAPQPNAPTAARDPRILAAAERRLRDSKNPQLNPAHTPAPQANQVPPQVPERAPTANLLPVRAAEQRLRASNPTNSRYASGSAPLDRREGDISQLRQAYLEIHAYLLSFERWEQQVRPIYPPIREALLMGLKGVVQPAVAALQNLYAGGGLPITCIYKRTHFLMDLLDQILFRGYTPFSLSPNEIEDLLRVAKHRVNMYSYERSFRHATDGSIISTIQDDINLLDTNPRSNKVTRLKNGALCIFIPSGWIQHRVTFEIRKDRDKWFFLIHNRGHLVDDARLHGNVGVYYQGKTYKKTIVTIETTKQNLLDPDFIGSLFYQKCRGTANEEGWKATYEALYQYFIVQRKGTIIVSQHERDLIATRQRLDQPATAEEIILLNVLMIKIMLDAPEFNATQLYGSCSESGVTTPEKEMASPRVRQVIKHYTLSRLIQNLSPDTSADAQSVVQHCRNEMTRIGGKIASKSVNRTATAYAGAEITNTELELYAANYMQACWQWDQTGTFRDAAYRELTYDLIPPYLKNDRGHLALLKHNPLILKFLPEETHRKKEIVLACLRNNPNVISHLHLDEIELSDEIISHLSEYVTDPENSFNYSNQPNYFNGYEATENMSSVQRNGLSLRNIPWFARKFGLCLAAVRQHGLALEFVPDNISYYKKVPYSSKLVLCILAIHQNGLALKHVKKILGHVPRNLTLLAVQRKGLALKFAEPAFQADKGIVVAAVAENKLARTFAAPALQRDPDVLQATLFHL